MALADLNRSNDTPIATLKLAPITPKDWPTFPSPVPSTRPVYVPTFSTEGGAVGDDVDQATATGILDTSTPNHPTTSWPQPGSPHTQAEKATNTSNTLVVDVGRARGAVAPNQPYPKKTDAALTAPTLSSLSPNTAAAGSPAVNVTVTGTGFTAWSTVETGNVPTTYVRYISPTQLQLGIDARRSVAGTITVVVKDHNVRSASLPFTFT